MIRRPPRSTQSRSSAASDVYKRQVLSHVFVSLPFVVIAVEGAFRSTDGEYDAAAATLGASRWTTFRRVTVPLALPGILAGQRQRHRDPAERRPAARPQ